MPAPPRTGYLSSPPPRALAHRGLAIDAPENTLLAFLSALAAGAEFIETDVRASLDGVAVISHDAELTRTAGSDLVIARSTLAQLQAIDLGHGQRIPTLFEALDGFPDARFNLDIKSEDAAAPAATAIRKARAQGRVLVTSFSERRRRSAIRTIPGVASSASARTIVLLMLASSLRLTPLIRRVLRGHVAVQIPERSRGLRVLTPRLIRDVHAAGVEVHVWTVNAPEDMRRLLALGVDGIVTDRVDVALAVFAESPPLPL